MKILTCKDLDNYSKETIFAYILELQSQVMKLNIIIEHSSEQNQRNVNDLSNQITKRQFSAMLSWRFIW